MSVSSPRATWKLLLASALVVAAAGGCTRPEGDFGRARPNMINDTIMPQAGRILAAQRDEPVSIFNMTDDERLLRDRSWALIRPPHSADWLSGTATELQRTRISAEIDRKLDPGAYYALLSSDEYRSSETRYDRVIADAEADAALLPPFCVVATRVEDLDAERMGTIGRRTNLSQEDFAGAVARVDENRVLTAWAARAARFRHGAYKIAIDKLEVETPSPTKVWDVNTSLRRLGGAIVLAEQGCRDAKNPFDEDAQLRKSRIFTGWGNERPAPVK